MAVTRAFLTIKPANITSNSRTARRANVPSLATKEFEILSNGENKVDVLSDVVKPGHLV